MGVGVGDGVGDAGAALRDAVGVGVGDVVGDAGAAVGGGGVVGVAAVGAGDDAVEGLPALLVLVLMMVSWRWALSKPETEWRAQGAGDEMWLGGDGEARARRR
jgi:hypothetical protein